MDGCLPAGRPRVRRGRPRTADNMVWEMDIKVGEDAASMLRMGPSLVAFKRCDRHRPETTLVLRELARMSRRDYHRRA